MVIERFGGITRMSADSPANSRSRRLANMPCVCRTPFCGPVVPEVSAMRSGASASGTKPE